MNMCMLEVAMREKCRSSHFQSKGVLLLGEGGGGGVGGGGGGGGGVSIPLHAIV